MKLDPLLCWRRVAAAIVGAFLWALLPGPVGLQAAATPNLTGSFTLLTAGTTVDLSVEGEVDWVHWGLLNESSLDRKAGVIPQISDITLLDSPTGYSFVYWFDDDPVLTRWHDGTPTLAVNDTTTGVWAYGTPVIGSGFQITVPADTFQRTLKVYLGVYGGRGRLEASLSDGSSRPYLDSSFNNLGNGPSGVYTIHFAANSSGQQLVVRWSLASPMKPDGNVRLQAATLTAAGVDNPPITSLTSPVENAKFVAGSTITLNATASDIDGTVSLVEFFSSQGKIGESATSPYSVDWPSVPAGIYTVWSRATDAEGGSSISVPVTIFVHGTGGVLTGSLVVPPALGAAINLTGEGTRDWAHWGLQTNSLFNHKAGVLSQISDLRMIGTNALQLYADNFSAFSWSDGTPTPSAAGATRGVYVTGLTNGFEIEVPADSTPRTLKVYVGLSWARGAFQAWLSDFSAPAYTDDTLLNESGNAYGMHTLTFASVSTGQTLHVRYWARQLFDRHYGNVTWQAASLSGQPITHVVPIPVMLIDPHWAGQDFVLSFATQPGAAYSVEFTPSLLQSSWQTWTNVLGIGATQTLVQPNPAESTRFYRVVSQ